MNANQQGRAVADAEPSLGGLSSISMVVIPAKAGTQGLFVQVADRKDAWSPDIASRFRGGEQNQSFPGYKETNSVREERENRKYPLAKYGCYS